MERVPISIYPAQTPNPNVIKFIADREIIDVKTASAEFRSKNEAEGTSPLAVSIFSFPFVKQVFISGNFISVTKKDGEMEWGYLVAMVREHIHRFIVEGNSILTTQPDLTPKPTDKNGDSIYKPSPFDSKIKELMEKYVKDPVQGDGGEILFRNFNNGVVTVLLKGACVGCPARNKTLKQGIEDILKKYIPEVKEVVAENG